MCLACHTPQTGQGRCWGKGNMLTGRRALLRAHVSESGEVIELDATALVQTDAELSEICCGLHPQVQPADCARLWRRRA